MKKSILKPIVKSLLKITLAGLILGFFHEYDIWLAILLGIHVVRKIYINYKRAGGPNYIFIFGMVLTGILGLIAEYWGTSNNYWEYHDLSNNREMPYWLLFAWMLAFHFMYSLEIEVLKEFDKISIKSKLILMVFISLIFPVYGEIITINLGVWTYYWPLQFFGVPLLAMFLLVLLHMVINALMYVICHKKDIKDPLFNPKND